MIRDTCELMHSTALAPPEHIYDIYHSPPLMSVSCAICSSNSNFAIISLSYPFAFVKIGKNSVCLFAQAYNRIYIYIWRTHRPNRHLLKIVCSAQYWHRAKCKFIHANERSREFDSERKRKKLHYKKFVYLYFVYQLHLQ